MRMGRLSVNTVHHALRRLNDPRDVRAGALVAGLLLLAESVLCCLIIKFVPYTEIDWEAYMAQVSTYRRGERDYFNLKGATGPLVYPGGFVHLFSLLQRITGGQILPAQVIYAAVYIATQACVMALFVRARSMPPWSLGLLCLSRRLHSIYLLRLFNDCWAMLLAYGATLLLQMRRWVLAMVVYSLAVSVKMNVLLFAPGVLAVVVKLATPRDLARGLLLGGMVQVAVAAPFMAVNAKAYLVRAFEFTRIFEHTWTVNWKFLPQDWFTSPRFAVLLLLLHLRLIWSFAQSKWLYTEGGVLNAIRTFCSRTPFRMRQSTAVPAPPVSNDFILYVVFTSVLVGMVCARSLHYQFYSWYFHMLPFLLLRTRLPLWLGVGILVCMELLWNLYPSSAISSGAILVLNFLITAAQWLLLAPAPEPKLKVLGKRPTRRR